MQGCIPPAVDLEHLLTCQAERAGAGLRASLGETLGPEWGPPLHSLVGQAETEAALWIPGWGAALLGGPECAWRDDEALFSLGREVG